MFLHSYSQYIQNKCTSIFMLTSKTFINFAKYYFVINTFSNVFQLSLPFNGLKWLCICKSYLNFITTVLS